MLRQYKIVSVNSCVSAHHRIYTGNLDNLASQAIDFGSHKITVRVNLIPR